MWIYCRTKMILSRETTVCGAVCEQAAAVENIRLSQTHCLDATRHVLTSRNNGWMMILITRLSAAQLHCWWWQQKMKNTTVKRRKKTQKSKPKTHWPKFCCDNGSHTGLEYTTISLLTFCCHLILQLQSPAEEKLSNGDKFSSKQLKQNSVLCFV